MKNFGHLCVMLLQLLLAVQTKSRFHFRGGPQGFCCVDNSGT